MKRIGLLGGSFNPPHEGHLRMGELAWEHLELDELRFVPAARSPHKPDGHPAPEFRERLLRLALQGRPWLVDTIELDRGGPSFTVDTLEALARSTPEAAWILVLGSDQAASLATWHRPHRIWELASVATIPRPGHENDLQSLRPRLQPRWTGLPGELVVLPGTGLDLSSSAIRACLSRDEVPSGVPPQVLAAILAENLYR